MSDAYIKSIIKPKDWDAVWNIISSRDIIKICNLTTDEKKTHLDTLIGQQLRACKYTRVLKVNLVAEEKVLAHIRFIKALTVIKQAKSTPPRISQRRHLPGDFAKSTTGKTCSKGTRRTVKVRQV